jgi:hypothetical protein
MTKHEPEESHIFGRFFRAGILESVPWFYFPCVS